jgi:hypothetical protein
MDYLFVNKEKEEYASIEVNSDALDHTMRLTAWVPDLKTNTSFTNATCK